MYFWTAVVWTQTCLADRAKLLSLLGNLDTKMSLVEIDQQYQLVSGGGSSAPPSRRRQDGQTHGAACDETDYNDADDPDCYSRRYQMLTQVTQPALMAASQSTYTGQDQFNQAVALLSAVPGLPSVNTGLASALVGANTDLQFATNNALATVNTIASDSQSRLGTMEAALTQAFSSSVNVLTGQIQKGQSDFAASLVASLNQLIGHANQLNTNSQSVLQNVANLQGSITSGNTQLRSATASTDALIDKIANARIAFDSNIFALQNAFGQSLLKAQTAAMQSATTLAASLTTSGLQTAASVNATAQPVAVATGKTIVAKVAATTASWNTARIARNSAAAAQINPLGADFAKLYTTTGTAANSLDSSIAASLAATTKTIDSGTTTQINAIGELISSLQTATTAADTWSGSSSTLLSQLTDKLAALTADLVSTVAGSQKNGTSSIATAALAAMAQVGTVQAQINEQLFAKQSSNLDALNALSATLAKTGMNFQTLMDAATAARTAIETSAKDSLSGGVSVTDGVMAALNEAVQTRSLALAALTAQAVDEFNAAAASTQQSLLSQISAARAKAGTLLATGNGTIVLDDGSTSLLNVSSAGSDMKAAGTAAQSASALLAAGVSQRQADALSLSDQLAGSISDGGKTVQTQFDRANASLQVTLDTSGIVTSSSGTLKSAGDQVSKFVANLQADHSIDRLHSVAAGVGLEQTASKATTLVSNAAQLYSDTNKLVSALWQSVGISGSVDGIQLLNPDVLAAKLAQLNSQQVLSQLADLGLRVAKIGPMPNVSIDGVTQAESDWTQEVNTVFLPQVAALMAHPVVAVNASEIEALQAKTRSVIATETAAMHAFDRAVKTGVDSILNTTANATRYFAAIATKLEASARAANVSVTSADPLASSAAEYKANATKLISQFIADMASARDQSAALNPPKVSSGLVTKWNGIAGSLLGNTSVEVDGLVSSALQGTEESTYLLAAQLAASLNASKANAALTNSGAVRALEAASGAVNATINMKSQMDSIEAMNMNTNENSAGAAVNDLESTQTNITSALMGAFSAIDSGSVGPTISSLDILKALVSTELYLTNHQADAQTAVAQGASERLNRTLAVVQSDLISSIVKSNGDALANVDKVEMLSDEIQAMEADMNTDELEKHEAQLETDVNNGTLSSLNLDAIFSMPLGATLTQ